MKLHFRFRLGTLFLLVFSLACYLAGYRHGWQAHGDSSPIYTKSYDVTDLLPDRHDTRYLERLNYLRYSLEESLNGGTAFYDMAPPIKVLQNSDGSIYASLPPHRVPDIDLLLAKMRELKQVAIKKGQPFDIPSPLRSRSQWEPE